MRNLALACGALAVISGIVSVNLWRELRAERQVVSDLRAQLQQQGSVPAGPVQTGFQPAAKPVVPGNSDATSGTPAPGAPAENRPQPAPAANNPFDTVVQQGELLKDPEYRRAALAQLRMSMPQAFPGLIEDLGLSPDQADSLFELLAEMQLEQNRISVPLAANGQVDQQLMQEYTRRREEITRQRDEKIGALLGNAGREKFQAYEQTRGARMQAQSTQRMMEGAGLPLRPDQLRPVTEAYVNEQRRQREEAMTMRATNSTDMMTAQMEMQAERNRRLLTALQPHLTPQQYEWMQASLDHQLAMNRVSSRLARERMEAQAQAGQQNGSVSIQFAPAAAVPLF